MDAATWAMDNRPALLVLMFHGLFRNIREAHTDDVDPYQPFVEHDLCRLIEHFQASGYRFISPDKMHLGLRTAPKRILLTFDDGYANNLRALPIMRRYGVPAPFFVTAGNVASGEAFWWDVLHRELARRGIGRAAAAVERQRLKALPVYAIRSTLKAMFGPDSLLPASETDWPMTIPEVKTLAAEPLATVGDHSLDHELLTRVPLDEARRQISVSQEMLTEWTGTSPRIIAYPNGNANDDVVTMAEQAGLKIGVTAEPGKSSLPLSSQYHMRIPRYAIVGGPGLRRQIRAAEAPFSLAEVQNRFLRRRQQATLR